MSDLERQGELDMSKTGRSLDGRYTTVRGYVGGVVRMFLIWELWAHVQQGDKALIRALRSRADAATLPDLPMVDWI